MDGLMVELELEPKTRSCHISGFGVDGYDLARSDDGGTLANQNRSTTRSAQKENDSEMLAVLDCWCCKILAKGGCIYLANVFLHSCILYAFFVAYAMKIHSERLGLAAYAIFL